MLTRKLGFILTLLGFLGFAAALSPCASGQEDNARDAVGKLPADFDWPRVGNDSGGRRYSQLKQIDTDNVRNLQVAWVYRTRDAGDKTTIECTPIVVDGVMYITTARTKVVALNAATAQELWQFDPYEDRAKNRIMASGGVNRGVAFWSDGRAQGERRIFAGLSDGRLISLDATTGKLDPAFANGGQLDLRKGIERDISKMTYGPTSAPMVFEDLVILGFSNDEGHPGAPGDIRAFDARTGKERWRFHTVPRPGEEGYDTWATNAWEQRGGANAWGGLNLEEGKGVLLCGTGSAGADFYGADRKGAGLFANCTLALDARTGRRLWHFQTVHHDVWDHDTPCPPVVVNVQHDGHAIDAVAQVTKTGYCYLFDLKTGQPVFPVREQPAPPSDIPGEVASATQPLPVKPPPFARQAFTDDDVTTLSPRAGDFVRAELKSLRYGEANMPPSLQGTVVTPGFHGGATWSGASFDPSTGYLYVNSNEVPAIIKLHDDKRGGYRFGGYRHFTDDAGYPAIKPPWGRLTAIDLNKGEFAWQIVLGEFPELKARGISPTGTENFGGTIVTAGGLVFIGATKDEKFRAFDKRTGKLLWEHQLEAGGYATPCTYAVGGRQFVVIAAGGGGKLGTKSGDGFVAFALPGSRDP
jgi:quinoprotein glucose dehydrogenase